MSHTPPVPPNRRRIIGPLVLGAAVALASCDQPTTPSPAIQPPATGARSDGATFLGSATISNGATDVTVAAMPANQWIIIRASGSLSLESNPECGLAATPYWPCPTGATIPEFGPRPYEVGPVEIWRTTPTSRTRVAVRAQGTGAVALLRSGTAGGITATMNISVPSWYEPGETPIPSVFVVGSYIVSAQSVPNPLKLVEGGASSSGARDFSLSTLYGLQLMNPTEPYYFDYYPTGFVTWRWIPGSNVSETPGNEPGVTVSACDFLVTCTYTPSGPGRMEASAYVEGREVRVRSVVAPPPDPCGGASLASGVSFNCQEPELTLTCNGESESVEVERTEEINCRATGDPSWEITGWTFKGGDFTIPDLQNGGYAHTEWTWDGQMVVGGTITVVAKKDGVELPPASIGVTVTPRNEFLNRRVSVNPRPGVIAELPAADQPPAKPADPSHLGKSGVRALIHAWDPANAPANAIRDVGFVTDGGPNHGLAYLKEVPLDIEAIYVVHPELAEGTAFHAAQASVAGNHERCLQSQFSHYIQLVLDHEGASLGTLSHLGYYERALNPAAASAVEGLVGSSNNVGGMAAVWETKLTKVAADAKSKMHTLHGDPGGNVAFGCAFTYDY